jgi:hypothetical protein
MLILENILQYSFIFNVNKIKFEKNNFPNISALYFWNYYLATVLSSSLSLLSSSSLSDYVLLLRTAWRGWNSE